MAETITLELATAISCSIFTALARLGSSEPDLAGIKQNRKTYRTFCEDKLVTTFKMGRDNVKAKEKKKERKMMEQKMNAG
jgi:hypothetical protein